MSSHKHPRIIGRTVIYLSALIALAILSGCGDDSDDPSATATHEPAAKATSAGAATASGDPVGIIAIGHSGLTGNNADPARRGEDTKEYSWATGTDPQINSIYERLIAVRPETEGHMYNAAIGGAVSDTLAHQAEEALAEVPAPSIVIVLTIDNDIRCDGTDAEHVNDFGQNVAAALRVISEGSPQSRILLVSFFGRPTPEDVSAITAARPDLKEFVTGSGICDWYNPAGDLVVENFATFGSIVDAYESEQARVCAQVPQCTTDGGAATRWEDDPIGDYTDDFTHLNITGLGRLAAHMWPVAEQQLEAAAQ